MVCNKRGFYFREGQYGRIGTRSNSRADVYKQNTYNNITKNTFKIYQETYHLINHLYFNSEKNHKHAIITDKCNIYPLHSFPISLFVNKSYVTSFGGYKNPIKKTYIRLHNFLQKVFIISLLSLNNSSLRVLGSSENM